ncbi:hypothetical protein INR49_009904 [Caranx melampygus]|nr:hypothetical protein INR49_009904 [Caranx melampygus]
MGLPGAPGSKGLSGPKGSKGESGSPGIRGTPGLAGQRGNPGERGELGSTGPMGLKGEKGTTGDRGREVKRVKRDGPDSLVNQAHLAPEGCKGTLVHLAHPDLKEDLVAAPGAIPGLDLLVLLVYLDPRDSGVFLDFLDPGDSQATRVDQGTLVQWVPRDTVNQVLQVSLDPLV